MQCLSLPPPAHHTILPSSILSWSKTFPFFCSRLVLLHGCGLLPPVSGPCSSLPVLLLSSQHRLHQWNLRISFHLFPDWTTFFYFLCLCLVTSYFFPSLCLIWLLSLTHNSCFYPQGPHHCQTERALFSPYFTWSPVASGSDYTLLSKTLHTLLSEIFFFLNFLWHCNILFSHHLVVFS